MKKTSLLVVIVLVAAVLSISGCVKDHDESTPKLIFRFRFDSTQARLNNLGEPSNLADGNAAQSPLFNIMSAHYLELAPTAFTALGRGTVLYYAPETIAGGKTAIDFDKSNFAGNGETFLTVPIKDIAVGEYEWLRISLAYQNYDIKYYLDTVINNIHFKEELPGTIASFIGYNTYINNYTIKNQNFTINANKKQGFWGFETSLYYAMTDYSFNTSGQAPEGSTTVVNPLFASSPVPQGSCVVTAAFSPGKLKITGKETTDIVIEISLSVNKSFEWTEVITDGRWEPAKGEQVVDMGIRGMIPKIQ
jgi:hypothetical protein